MGSSNRVSSKKPKRVSTFLGVDPGTLTIQEIKKKGERDKAAADKRAPVVNAGISKQIQTVNDYAQRGQALYNSTAKSGRDSLVLQNPIPSVNKARMPGYSYTGKYQGGGQFQGIKTAVDYWRDSYRPKNISEYAQYAAKVDTTRNPDEYRFYSKYRLSQNYHDEAIAVGQGWMSDQKKYTDWILSAPDSDESNRRIEQAEEYFKNALHEVPTYDPETGTYSTQLQFRADAELPPWIEPTAYNSDIWEYYTTYSHDVVGAAVQAYNDARAQAREYSRNPYKSAFAGSEQTGQIDSFLDVAIKAMDPSTVNEDLLGNYFKDYIVNPIKAGKLKTAAGNALWNLMDTMDVASRGVRAFAAGDTVLGGSNATFKGQKEYWVHVPGYDENQSKLLQERFMKNGGYELLRLDNPNSFTGHITGNRDELIKQLDEAFGGRQNWDSIYQAISKSDYFDNRSQKDLKQSIKNIKKAYTDVDANFNADTGNMASDIVVETVLDPGTLFGGISKNIAKRGVESAAELAVKKGLRDIALDDDTAKIIMDNKYVRGAFKQFINSNEGKNIIFRSTKDFENDIDNFIMKLREAKVFTKDETAQVFKDSVVNQLMGKQIGVNGAVIASQGFARKTLDSKAFKSAYYLDKAIDGVDSAIVKSSFFLPWAGLKGSKALYDNAVNLAAKSELIQKAAARLNIRKANAFRTLLDEKTNKINVTKISDLMDQYESGLHHEKDVRASLQLVVDKYDDIAWNINDVIRKFSAGEINDEEAFRIIGEMVRDATGGQYHYVHELAGYVDSLAIRYSGDIRSAYGRVDDAFKRLQNLVDRRSENAVSGFLDKVRQAQNTDELMRLFRENMDNPYIMELRDQIIDNAQFNITAGELDELVDAVRTGRFADTSIDTKTLHKGLMAQSKASDKTLRRTVSFDTFDNILQSMGVDWKKVVADLEVPENNVDIFEKKISEFMKGWADQKYVTYNTDDMLKFVDRFQRQLQVKELMKVDTPSEVSALAAHQMVGQFNKLRKQLKRLDLVNLKDVKVITLPQMDRMAMNLEFRNNTDIQNLYGGFYDDVIAPLWNQFRSMSSDEVDLVDSSLFKDIDELARQKYGFDRTSQLIEEAKTLPGFSDDHLHSFLNTLATDFRFRDDLGNIDLTPGGLRRKIEANLRAQTGESKVGMKNITDALQSLDSDNPSGFLKNYASELKDKPELLERYNRYVQTDVLDPRAYVEKQMLFTALADPSVIPEWNALAAKGQAPIAMHINSTGLNTEINSMTSISFRKWVPIEISEENPLTLERLLDAMDEGETTVFQRHMNDSEFGEYTEQVIRKLDIKDANVDRIMERLKGVYGIPEGGNYKSEDQMIEEVCSYLNDATILKDDGLRSVAPTLLVHDLDGFNVNYLNNKIFARANTLDPSSKTYDYINRVAKSAKDNSCNTYTRLAEQVGDLYYTDEQLELITNMLHDYIDDINHFANGYKFNDMQSYSRKMHNMIEELKLKENANQLTENEKRFLDTFRATDGDEVLGAYDNAVRNITDLGLYPRQYAFLSSDIDENLTKVALDATGRTAVNTGSRIYVDDVLSYFNLETADGFYAPIEDLRKMNEVSQYIIRTRNRQIVAGAEEFLLPHKADFDRVIQSVIDLSKGNSYEATKLSYLQNMKIPDNAIDSYLMAKKLYSDHLKYWLDTDNVSALRSEGADLDYMKTRLYEYGRRFGFDDPYYSLANHDVFEKACDYANTNRVRFFDELVGGGFSSVDETLDLLQGAHESEIYNWAAKSDFEKQVLTYKNGVMKSGLDKATHYIEAGSQLKSDMRQLQHMDEYFATAGIIRRQDRMTASVYSKSKQLFDMLEDSDLLKRDSFQDFLQKASRTHRLHLQQYRLNALRNADGVFDRTKLLSDLVYNGFNMSVFNAYNYTPKEMDELLGFVKDLQKNGDDFLSHYEDRTTGNIFIYLNDNCTVAEADGGRWINQKWKFDRPVHEVVDFPEFDELKEVLDIDDIEDFREVYAHLKSCWEDTRILSMGQINGTTGKTISRRQADEFIQSLPSNMNDWNTSYGLLQDELTRGVIYDPGFVVNEESDMLTDFLGTLQRQAETAKDDAILINEVFHSTGSVQFSELAQNFSTDELVEYFGENPEYIVCTIEGDAKTASGFRVKQLNLNNAAGVEIARNMQNTTILPYSTYYEISNYMNRDVSDNVYKKLLGKYMLVYKAFALVKPGTWMRNFIDATTKAAFDNKEGLSGVVSMVQYEAKAARDIGTYGRIIAADPKLLNPANWDIIQSTFKTDMTFDDFELLRGLMDSDRYKSADRYFLSRTAEARGGFNVISGENIGLRNLEEKDIKQAVKKYLSGEPDLPLKENEFLDIYLGKVEPDDTTRELYEDMFSRLSNNLRNSSAGNVFDKTIDTMFKPFGQVEELVRYAQTLQLRDNGFSQNQITRHIHNTQFYNAPTWGKWRQLETIMPFITFKYNNMMYWVRMMDENPRLFRYFEDTYRSVYETTLESAFEEGVELDYENDYGLQSGAIPIGNGKAYFNLGNSFFSAMNDFYGIPHDIDSLNPLLRDTVRTSMYTLGLNSKQFFKDLNLEISDEELIEHSKELLPGYKLFRDSIKTFKDIAGMSTSSGGPSMNAFYRTMKLFGIMGVRWQYRDKTGRFSFDEYQADLAKQGKWYDANRGMIVDLSEKNEYGANDPNNTFEDVQAYMMTHFEKIWDANQNKFVTMDQYQEGGLNDGFDFDNDPDAWDKLCETMREKGKRWDNNQRKFVYFEDYISGGLNTPNLDWDSKVALMEEKFPNLIWDANQQAFVEKRFYIRGGMNDFSQYSGDDFLSHWNELKSLRLALYGESYNKATHKFEQTAEPSIILWDQFMGLDDRKKYDNYYSQLGIPRLMDSDKPLHVTDEGLLVNSDGQYILTGNSEYDARVFDKFRHTFSYGGRSYNGHKNYSYNKTRKSSKPYKGRTLSPTYYQTGYGWNSEQGYYREAFEYSYQYHSPQPGAKLNRLISPPRFYPYGGGYNKFSFISRY